VIATVVRSVWTAPRAARAPGPATWDWALVAAFVGTAVLEAVLRPEVVWRPVAAVEAIGLAFALPWRRTHPLAVFVACCGGTLVVDLAGVMAGVTGEVGLYTMMYLLLLPYAVFRWGSGRETVIGSAIALTGYAVGTVRDHSDLGACIAGFVVLVFPAVLGLSLRFRSTSRLRELEQVRFRERELLARELHDTVAHHVTAIVIRAQAGQVVAPADPHAALEALQVIEAEGTRTLTEMRSIVRALREGEDAELAPAGGLADIVRLARPADGRPGVQVDVRVDSAELSPSVEGAAYRIVQEAVTNSLRHARHAGRILVQVDGEDDRIRLTVRDDGDLPPAARGPGGYGISGMTERAKLLGGSLHAGPGPDRGWLVEAVLPRRGVAG